MSKAITGGYGGLSAVITTSKIANAVKGEFGLYSTYGWHPRLVAVAVALANLRHLTRHGNRDRQECPLCISVNGTARQLLQLTRHQTDRINRLLADPIGPALGCRLQMA
jgi:adenosylmethionine-8-amino-7-oxononanoate aminotransferase